MLWHYVKREVTEELHEPVEVPPGEMRTITRHFSSSTVLLKSVFAAGAFDEETLVTMEVGIGPPFVKRIPLPAFRARYDEDGARRAAFGELPKVVIQPGALLQVRLHNIGSRTSRCHIWYEASLLEPQAPTRPFVLEGEAAEPFVLKDEGSS